MTGDRITDSGDLRKYRTEIPNIIYSLGLTPFELALYNALKRTAGQNGTSRKSTPTLAKESGMSPGMVSKAKVGLAKPRPLLGNKPLIVINKEKNRNGGKAKDMIDIVDIWRENMAYFSKEQVHQNEGQVHGVNVTSSPSEIKKEPLEERTTRKETPRVRATELVRPENPNPEPVVELIADMIAFAESKVGAIASHSRQSKAIKWLFEFGYGVEESEACFEYLLTEDWRSTTITWATVQKEIGNWQRRGSPERYVKQNGQKPQSDYTGPVQSKRDPKKEGCQDCFGTGMVMRGRAAIICKHDGSTPREDK